MSDRKIKRFDSVEQLNRFAAEEFVRLADESVKSSGRFTVALSGGSTPKKLYELLAADKFASRIDWQNVLIFWGDERCVPPDSGESNYRMANEALLSKVPIPAENIHQFQTELGDPRKIAELMEAEIASVLSLRNGEFPRFDLILLGMGTDGHTASLFPETKALEETAKFVVENYVPKFGQFRLTFTYPTINNARNIMFLIAGEDKKEPLKKVLHGIYQPAVLPSQAVKPTNGNLTFFIA